MSMIRNRDIENYLIYLLEIKSICVYACISKKFHEFMTTHLLYKTLMIYKKCNKKYNNNKILIWASVNGHLEVVKYLVYLGTNIRAKDDYVVRWASKNGRLEVVKHLVSLGANIRARDDYAVKWASENGCLG